MYFFIFFYSQKHTPCRPMMFINSLIKSNLCKNDITKKDKGHSKFNHINAKQINRSFETALTPHFFIFYRRMVKLGNPRGYRHDPYLQLTVPIIFVIPSQVCNIFLIEFDIECFHDVSNKWQIWFFKGKGFFSRCSSSKFLANVLSMFV